MLWHVSSLTFFHSRLYSLQIRHLQSTLSLRSRTRLTLYIHDLYLSSAPHHRYYHVPLHDINQYITAYIDAWAESVTELFSGNLMKPSFDVLLFTSHLARFFGSRGTVLLFINYCVTAKILRAVTLALGCLAAVEDRLEGQYRAGVGRVGRESEEVALYDGGVLRTGYPHESILAIDQTCEFDIQGSALVVRVLWMESKEKRGRQQKSDMDGIVSARTEAYISNRHLLLSLADAGGRLMCAYKDLQEVARLTGRGGLLTLKWAMPEDYAIEGQQRPAVLLPPAALTTLARLNPAQTPPNLSLLSPSA
ncbi:ABC transporter transmembrane region 2-domain-containing protein [Suillus subaureus]|uniref:ABC transporter transmembrane region 2-domain-containing protein n=1 Tax=Suillus subaureus TaxID=48587 RepID=A0A9P7E6A4_9AGAM|nr:ABC transporter transmembrane region 2-domain-containing protein [Suillus subaureus]KAG1811769.1 ABC transporter transmembrane region 2-domain-containing protein [Suillus subaureus]